MMGLLWWMWSCALGLCYCAPWGLERLSSDSSCSALECEVWSDVCVKTVTKNCRIVTLYFAGLANANRTIWGTTWKETDERPITASCTTQHRRHIREIIRKVCFCWFLNCYLIILWNWSSVIYSIFQLKVKVPHDDFLWVHLVFLFVGREKA